MLNVSPRVREYETLPGLNKLGIPAATPLPTGETEDTQRIVERFGADIVAAGVHNGLPMVYVSPEKLIELAQFVRTDEKLQYEALIDVSAIDTGRSALIRQA